MKISVVNVGDSEGVAFRDSLLETAVVSASGLGVAAIFYLANYLFGTEQTKEGLSELLNHFGVVPLYFPVVAGWVAAAAVLLDALLYEARKHLRSPKWLTQVLRTCLEGLSHVHAFPLIVLALVAAHLPDGAHFGVKWLTILVMAFVAVLSGLAAKLMEIKIEARTLLERVSPYPYFVLWTLGLIVAAR